MDPFPLPKAFGQIACVCGGILKGGRFAVLKEGAQAPVGFR
jgi:hypothetical protein